MWALEKSISTRIIKYLTAILFGIAGVILLVLSIFVRETNYIRRKPWKFVLEIVVLGVLSAAPIYLVAKNRKSSYKRATRDFVILVVQFVVFWILMELSGFNEYVFPEKVGKIKAQ